MSSASANGSVLPATGDERLAAYRRDGFTVFPGLHAGRVAAWREAYPALRRRFNAPHGGDDGDLVDLVELAPEQFLDAVADPAVLDFAERVMGPRVQLDSVHFRLDPVVPPEQRLRPVHWHRDMDAQFPPEGAYLHPFAINAITYLQDLDDDLGPFRAIPGSHRRALAIAPRERQAPRPDEILLRPRAGDVIVTHNGLWHSGSCNVSGRPRFFLSCYYHVNWLPTRDNLAGPAVARIKAWARGRGDARLLRLFGEDPLRAQRMHATGMEPEDETWRRWRDEERALSSP
jgi:hypothetical protein